MASERLLFQNRDGNKLAAYLDVPEESPPRAYALFAHCFTCGKNLKPIVNINKSLVDHGIGVLRFDFTGIGESRGDFAETTFTSNVEDLVDASEFLAGEYESPRLLIGHSMGGAAVLQAAHHIDSVTAVVTIAAPAHPNNLSDRLREVRDRAKQDGAAEVNIGGKRFTLKRQFFEDLERHRMEKFIRDLNRALLILHSPADDTVDVQNAAEIFQSAKHPKSFISLDNMGHLILEEPEARYVVDLIGRWTGRYV